MKNNSRSNNKGVISRRSFINRAAAGTTFIALGPVTGIISSGERNESGWPADAKKFRFHAIGQAHIDPVWLWPWTEGISVVHSTFRSALDRMKENAGFTFTASSAQFYQWIAENDPEMLEEIRSRIDEGRWNVVGGWWVEPDMNIPSGEAMVRQGLYGQLTMQSLLGHRATVAFNPDSFGHTSSLPQIIKGQGMENYVFMRPGIKEKDIPADLFRWKGCDGTEVLTYRIPISYTDNGPVRKRIEQIMAQFRDQPVKTVMSYYGAGDHGGGATKENIASITTIQGEKDAPVLLFSTPERYFREIRDDKTLVLPVVDDDLQHHATGCYTAESEIKKNNRLAESALVTGEKISAIGSVAWGCNYPGQEFASAWKRVLFLQFHDSMAGTSVPEHSQAAREGFSYALDIAHQATYKAVQKLEWQIAAEDPSSQYLVAFNPHAWEVQSNFEYDFNWDSNNQSSAEDENGNPLHHQWTAGSTETGSRKRVIVKTTIPPLGYRQIRIHKGNPEQVTPGVKVTENSMENEFIKLSVSPSGSIGLFEKVSAREVFLNGETGCKAVIIADPSDTWSHDIKSFSNITGSFGNATVIKTEEGPLRAILRVKTTYGSSALTIDWIMYAGSSDIEARVTLDWHEHLKMLKFSFPVNADKPVSTYETPYGFITREANGNEEPGQRWIDVTGNSEGRTFGLTVFNDAKYGYSINGSDMRISVARSAVYAHHNPRVLDMKSEHIWQDQGIQTFRMLLHHHKDSWRESGVTRLAEEFMSPSILIYQGIHGGKMPKADSFISVDSENVIISAIKQSEDNNDLIIRCVETEGSPAKTIISFRFAGREWKGNFRPCEIKTLKLDRKTGDIREGNLLEE